MSTTDITALIDSYAREKLSPSDPLITSSTFNLRESMTALEIGDDRMDVDFSSPLLLDLCVPLPPSSSTDVDAEFESILSATGDPIIYRPPIPSYSSLNEFAVKLNVRLVSYLQGCTSFMESVGTAGVSPTIHVPPEGAASPPSPEHDRRAVKCFLHLVCFNAVMAVRDLVWYGDVYEEEDLGMSYNDVDMGVWKRESSQLNETLESLRLAPPSDLPPPDAELRASALALCSVWLEFFTYAKNLAPTSASSVKLPTAPPSSPPLLPILEVDKVIIKDITLPPAPPNPPNTTFVQTATTTFADPPFFQSSILKYYARGHPVHACIYPSVSESVEYWQKALADLSSSVSDLVALPSLPPHFLSR